MTALHCRLCALQGRTTPVVTTAGVHVCPICDRGYSPAPTPAQARHAKEKP